MELPFCPCLPHTHFFRGVSVSAVYLLFKSKPTLYKLFAHRLVVLFYTLNYLCSIFDSSAETKKSLKKTSNNNSKQTKLTKWGEGISLSSGNICSPQSFTLEETALGHPEMGSCRRLGGCLRSVQQGAQCGLRRSGHPHPHFACHQCSQAEGLLWWVFPPILWLPRSPTQLFPTR